jgi:hypothetical protein
MPAWIEWSLAVLVFVVVAPAVALSARRYGRTVRGGAIFVGLLLGLGQVLDPPSKHRIEAGDEKRKDRAAPGEPPLDG